MPDLVASGEGVDDLSMVGDGRPLGQAIDPRSVVQAAVEATKLTSADQALKRLVNGIATADVEEIHRCP